MASQVITAFLATVKASAKEAGIELKANSQKLALYSDELVLKLSRGVGLEGFDEAKRAAKTAWLLEAAGVAVDTADSNQARFLDRLDGALVMAARLIVAI